jgi:hypothetical protein
MKLVLYYEGIELEVEDERLGVEEGVEDRHVISSSSNSPDSGSWNCSFPDRWTDIHTDRYNGVRYGVEADDYNGSNCFMGIGNDSTDYLSPEQVLPLNVCRTVQRCLMESLEVVAKIIQLSRTKTLRTYHDNIFAYEVKDGKLNIIHVVNDIAITPEILIGCIHELKTDVMFTKGVIRYLNDGRYDGSNVSVYDFGVPMAYTYSPFLPFLTIPRPGMVKWLLSCGVTDSELDYKVRFCINNFSGMLKEWDRHSFGNCWNYIVRQ